MAHIAPIAAGFIIEGADAIYGIGADEAAAWADFEREMQMAQIEVVDECDPDALPKQTARSAYKAKPATAALLEQVQEWGGIPSWNVVGGVACTDDEAGTVQDSE